jgi:hypothetical protein
MARITEIRCAKLLERVALDELHRRLSYVWERILATQSSGRFDALRISAEVRP